ncbi:MAG: MFS transporter [Caldilineaceae bacterium]|nr:MFS transporter [Caldilineaceae bacterium]
MDKKRLFAASYGHLSIDILNSSVAMILTLIAGNYELSIAQIGFGAMMYQMFAAMSQPLFGGLTDKLRGRWVGPIGLLWTIVFYAVASYMPSYPLFITLLMFGGLGSGAFHAAGMVNAAVSGGKRATTSTSVFFLGGQSGLAFGPIIAGFVVGGIGLVGMPFMAALMLPAVAFMLMYMNDPLPDAPKRAKPVADHRSANARHGATALLVTAFVLFIMLRSGTAQGYATLLPKYFSSQGFDPVTFGLMLGLFNFSGALGTLTGGFLGDRYNRRLVMAMASVLSAPFAFLMLYSQGTNYLLVAVAAGLLLSIPHSILLVMTQELAPNRRGLMGGLVLGFIFASGSAMAWIESVAADSYGLQLVLSVVAILPVAAGAIALMLPGTRPSTPVPATPTPSAAAD